LVYNKYIYQKLKNILQITCTMLFLEALFITHEDFILEKINIKDITKRHDLNRVRGRIIGTRGKTLETLESLSDCFISLHDNTVGIIGRAEEIETSMQAIKAIIRGKKQSKTYSYLEREKSKPVPLSEDLGLKIKEEKKKKNNSKKRASVKAL